MNDSEYRPKQILTKREKEVFELLVQDKTTRDIAGELFISEKTVRNHISNAMHTNSKALYIQFKNHAQPHCTQALAWFQGQAIKSKRSLGNCNNFV